MNCQDFEIIILGMARAQLLEASARRQAIAHIAGCEVCADRLAEQQALTAAVSATSKSLRNEEASSHVEQSLRAAFRNQSNAATVFNSRPVRARQWPKLTFAAVAAIVLLILLAGVIRQWRFGEQKQKVAEVRPSPIETQKDEPNLILPPDRETVRQIANQRRQPRQPVQSGVANREEVTTEFIALANENELVPLESGQVLRVELSAPTLISMGLPITAEDMSKPVLADLLVGQDGLARAIRFVRPGVINDVGSPQPPNNK